MTVDGKPWTVRLSQAAEGDYQHLVTWTAEHFGQHQARVYAETVSLALMALASGPSQPGVRVRDDIAKGIFTLHVARRGRRGRHFVMFRVVDSKARVLDVLRVLHDAMDPSQHLPE